MKRPDPKPDKPYRASANQWARLRENELGAWCDVCCRARADSLHHIVRKSQSGDDYAVNLLSVCGDGVRGCHGLIEARDPFTLSIVRTLIEARIPTLSYVLNKKGYGWLERSYPEQKAA